MTRLWDNGAPLDERVLNYTAGEDSRAADEDVRQPSSFGNGLRRNSRPFSLLPSIGETELIRPARREGVMIGEQKILVL